VIPSNLFQPATAQIGAIADRMGIPSFNGLPAPVQKHQMLGSYSVNWPKIGANTAGIVEQIVFKGVKLTDIKPSVPTPADHEYVISGTQLTQHKLALPAALKDCNCVVK
jgi:putative ABC transport system substrate-binding protein